MAPRTRARYDIGAIQIEMVNNVRLISQAEARSEMARAVKDLTIGLHRYAVAYTHVGQYRQSRTGTWYYTRSGGVGGGSLRASHRMAFVDAPDGPEGRIYIDPSSINPRTGRRPAEYGVYEHARGGDHAFYDRALTHADALAGNAMGRLAARLID